MWTTAEWHNKISDPSYWDYLFAYIDKMGGGGKSLEPMDLVKGGVLQCVGIKY